MRAANPLEDVIQEYFPLQADGRGFKILCPFHSEKTPSFKVNPENGQYHCFGCQERGDVFSFVQKIESLEFSGALRFLAERGSIELTPYRGAGGRSGGQPVTSSEGGELGRKSQFEALHAAQLWFERQLGQGAGPQAPGMIAQRYLGERGFSAETLKQFAVGCAPPGWSNLLDQFSGRQFRPQLLDEVGLAKPRSSNTGYYDVFRDRIMFPIRNLQGRVVGFGGRFLASTGGAANVEKKEPKYLNSSESSLFKKGQILYGLYEGRDAIRKDRRLLLMEGYTDVMMAHQAGFPHAVATLGTALAETNVEQLCRHAEQLTLVFDGDHAGREAALKAVSLLLPRPVEVHVAVLPAGVDPCDLLTEGGTTHSERGVARFAETLEHAKSSLDFVLWHYLQVHGREGGDSKDRVAREFYPFLMALTSEIRLAEGIRLLARAIRVEEGTIEKGFGDWKRGKAPRRLRQDRNQENIGSPTLPGLEDALLLCAMSSPERAEIVFGLQPPERFRSPLLRAVATAVAQGGEETPELADTAARSKFFELKDRLSSGGFDDENAAKLIRDLLVQRHEHRGALIRTELRDAPENERDPLLREWQENRRTIDRLRGTMATDWQAFHTSACDYLAARLSGSQSVPTASPEAPVQEAEQRS